MPGSASWRSPTHQLISYQHDHASSRTHVITAAGDRESLYDARNRVVETHGASQPTDAYA